MTRSLFFYVEQKRRLRRLREQLTRHEIPFCERRLRPPSAEFETLGRKRPYRQEVNKRSNRRMAQCSPARYLVIADIQVASGRADADHETRHNIDEGGYHDEEEHRCSSLLHEQELDEAGDEHEHRQAVV
jgi:hypothetical protein